MSLAVYITDREAGIINEYLDSSMFFTSRENIGIHLVFQEGVSATFFSFVSSFLFPILNSTFYWAL